MTHFPCEKKKSYLSLAYLPYRLSGVNRKIKRERGKIACRDSIALFRSSISFERPSLSLFRNALVNRVIAPVALIGDESLPAVKRQLIFIFACKKLLSFRIGWESSSWRVFYNWRARRDARIYIWKHEVYGLAGSWPIFEDSWFSWEEFRSQLLDCLGNFLFWGFQG